MVSCKILVTDPAGLHLRSAGEFVDEMNRFASSVTILFKDQRIDGKSLLNIMMGGIKCGAEIEVECSGEDEAEALAAAIRIIGNELT